MRAPGLAAALGLALAALAAPAGADTPPTQLERLVDMKLEDYGYRVDTTHLTTEQLSALHTLLNSEGPMGVPGQKRMRIESILERPEAPEQGD